MIGRDVRRRASASIACRASVVRRLACGSRPARDCASSSAIAPSIRDWARRAGATRGPAPARAAGGVVRARPAGGSRLRPRLRQSRPRPRAPHRARGSSRRQRSCRRRSRHRHGCAHGGGRHAVCASAARRGSESHLTDGDDGPNPQNPLRNSDESRVAAAGGGWRRQVPWFSIIRPVPPRETCATTAVRRWILVTMPSVMANASSTVWPFAQSHVAGLDEHAGRAQIARAAQPAAMTWQQHVHGGARPMSRRESSLHCAALLSCYRTVGWLVPLCTARRRL